MTTGEVAAAFGVSKKTVKRWQATGLLTAVRTPGGSVRYRSGEVQGLLASRLEQAKPLPRQEG